MKPTLDAADRVTGELIDVFLPLAQAADRKINPRRWTLADYSTAAHSEFHSYDAALAWLDSTAPVICGTIRIANATARHEAAWKMAEALHAWLNIRKDWVTWKTSHEVALESARECGAAPLAHILTSLGECHLWQDDPVRAENYLLSSRARWAEVEHSLGQASCLEALGTLALKKGEPQKARELVSQARERFAAEGREREVVLMQRCIGESYRDEDLFDQAISILEPVFIWFVADGDEYQQIRTGRSLALALGGAGSTGQMRILLEELISIATAIGADTDARELSRLMPDLAAGI
ncbi:tetratricopeptide repeat protein [Nocardiopsis metallicus]|uniref:Tetratricopeptide (TPR) repeat protein n=1 Tax=Nocardiopsis metallicus TaxID=179819 RepID=A0A840W5Z5_9ACTN|nr:tetratricopeptide repeat protein [Nocardiopsis metallicus]MBB5491424.1 tetratricopeptide (TPR) repeat protein [Nocardiopsis metallicus]